MRTLFDYQAFSIQSHGGISRYVLELGSRLAARFDIETRLYAGWHRNLMLRDAAPTWADGRYIRTWPKTGPLRHALNRALTRRYVRRWRPQLVHETYFRTGEAYLPGIPTVLTIYDLIYFILPNTSAEAARVRADQKAAITRADHLICISETTRRDLLRLLPVESKRVSVIPLAGPARRPANAPLSPHPDIDGPYLLYVGPRHSYKNFDVILQALAASHGLSSNVRLLAFGERPFNPAEIARIRALGLDPTRVVHRVGGDDVLQSCYARATALVCPSLYEGFGLPALEAMAAGCPVICSNRGSLPEVTGDAALLFDPESPGELATALETVVTSPQAVVTLRARGYAQAARYSWDRCADETLAVYQNLVG